MDSEKTVFLKRYAISVALLALSLVVFPLLAVGAYLLGPAPLSLPRMLSNALFFWPQYLLLPYGVVDRATEISYWVTTARYPSAVFWLAATAAYIWLTRGARLKWVVAGLFPAIAVLVQLVLWVLGAFGYVAFLDGL